MPYDPAPDPALADALATAGYPVPLRSRDALAATIAPADSATAEAMQAATVRASRRAARLTTRATRAGTSPPCRPALVTTGIKAITVAIRRYRDDGTVTSCDEAAWLTVGRARYLGPRRRLDENGPRARRPPTSGYGPT